MIRWSLPTRWRPRAATPGSAVVAMHWDDTGPVPRLALARAEPGRGLVRGLRVEATAAAVDALAAGGVFRGARRVLMLDASSRQTLVVDAPPVPEAEWAEALRWPVARALDAEAEDLLFDHAPVPALNDRGGKQLLVAATRLGSLKPRLDALAARGLRPHAVDVVDMAQRNLVLATTPDDAPATAAQVVVGAHGGELLVGLVAAGALCVARNVALPATFSLDTDDGTVTERLVLHVQRTVDLFERQITRFAITTAAIVVDDFPPATADALRQALPMATRDIGLAALGPAPSDPPPAPADRGLLARLGALARVRADRPEAVAPADDLALPGLPAAARALADRVLGRTPGAVR